MTLLSKNIRCMLSFEHITGSLAYGVHAHALVQDNNWVGNIYEHWVKSWSSDVWLSSRPMPGNPTCCVFLSCDVLVDREWIFISLLPSSGWNRKSSTSGSSLLFLVRCCCSPPTSLTCSAFLLNRHLQAHACCQAVLREITIWCKFTYGSSDSLNFNACVCRMFEHVSLLKGEWTIIWMQVDAQHLK